MKSILEAIQKHPGAFIATAKARAMTSPSYMNRGYHITLANAIQTEDWNIVREIITNENYRRAFEGVVHCLKMYGGLDDHLELHQIFTLFENDMMV